jgi:transposase
MLHAAADELVEPTRECEATGRNDGDVAKLAGVSQQTVSRVVNRTRVRGRAGAFDDARAGLSTEPAA